MYGYTTKNKFNAYLVCGNQNWYEGEGGYTYDSIRVDECDDSTFDAKLSDRTLDEYDILDTYTADIELDSDYGVCANCELQLQWSTVFLAASMELTSGSNN